MRPTAAQPNGGGLSPGIARIVLDPENPATRIAYQCQSRRQIFLVVRDDLRRKGREPIESTSGWPHLWRKSGHSVLIPEIIRGFSGRKIADRFAVAFAMYSINSRNAVLNNVFERWFTGWVACREGPWPQKLFGERVIREHRFGIVSCRNEIAKGRDLGF